MSSLRAARNESVARLLASSLTTDQAATSLYDRSVARLLAEHYHSSEAIAYCCNAYFLNLASSLNVEDVDLMAQRYGLAIGKAPLDTAYYPNTVAGRPSN